MLVGEMERVSSQWIAFRSELAVYECGATCTYKWKSSQLQAMISNVSSECKKLGDGMRKVAAIKLSQSQLLTLSMSNSIAEKMHLLVGITAHLGVLSSTI